MTQVTLGPTIVLPLGRQVVIDFYARLPGTETAMPGSSIGNVHFRVATPKARAGSALLASAKLDAGINLVDSDAGRYQIVLAADALPDGCEGHQEYEVDTFDLTGAPLEQRYGVAVVTRGLIREFADI